MPSINIECINSWKKHLTHYNIVEWNESNFDISINNYVKQAYEQRKYAFVSDYVRLYAIYGYGGIYMDTDVEVIKPFDDILNCDAFSGYETVNTVPTGIMGGIKGHIIYKDLLEYYEERTFVTASGECDLTTNVEIITDYFKRNGVTLNNTLQTLYGFRLYPKDYFCPEILPYGGKYGKNTYTVHHFSGSWLPDRERRKRHSIFYNHYRRSVITLRNMIIWLIGRDRFDNMRGR